MIAEKRSRASSLASLAAEVRQAWEVCNQWFAARLEHVKGHSGDLEDLKGLVQSFERLYVAIYTLLDE